MYDVCSRQSFTKLDAWFEELETYATNTNIVKMLVGNKIDKVNIKFEMIMETITILISYDQIILIEFCLWLIS